jgi:hypothetical protein
VAGLEARLIGLPAQQQRCAVRSVHGLQGVHGVTLGSWTGGLGAIVCGGGRYCHVWQQDGREGGHLMCRGNQGLVPLGALLIAVLEALVADGGCSATVGARAEDSVRMWNRRSLVALAGTPTALRRASGLGVCHRPVKHNSTSIRTRFRRALTTIRGANASCPTFAPCAPLPS